MEFQFLPTVNTVREKYIFSKAEVQIHPDVASLDDDYLEGTIQIVARAENCVTIEWHATRRLTSLSTSVSRNTSEQELAKHSLIIDIKSLKSVRRVRPQSGWPYLTFYAKDGTQYPPLHFHSRGTGAFLNALGKYVSVTRSQQDPHIYMVSEHDKEALVRSFNELAIFTETQSQVSSHFVGIGHHGGADSLGTRFSNFFRGRFATSSGKDNALKLSPDGHRDRTPSKTSSTSSISTRPSESGSVSIPGTRNFDAEARQLADAASRSTEFNFVAENDGFELVSTASPPRSRQPSELPPRRVIRRRGSPVTEATWRSLMDSNGAIRDRDALRLRAAIFRGSLDASMRKEGWKALLNYTPMDLTREQRAELMVRRREEYYAIKLQWRSVTAEQEANWTAFRERRSLIEKDVHRTDRELAFFAGDNNPNLAVLYDILVSYTFYNQDLGYVQGMSDLLAPCLQVVQDEVEAFWCFVGLMRRLAANFELDQSSMKRQLGDVYRVLQFLDGDLCNHLEAQECQNMYFCFRWLLIHFKREFTLADTLRLWETLWSDLPCRNYALLIAVAILDRERGVILENNFGYSEILRHVNSLARQLCLDEILERAECIFMQLFDAYRSGILPDELIDLFSLAESDPTLIGFDLEFEDAATLTSLSAPDSLLSGLNGRFDRPDSHTPLLRSFHGDVPTGVDLRAASSMDSSMTRADQHSVLDDFQRIAGLSGLNDADNSMRDSIDDSFRPVSGSMQHCFTTSGISN